MGCQWQLAVCALLEVYYMFPPGNLIWIICKHSSHWNAILQSDIFGPKDRRPGQWPLDYKVKVSDLGCRGFNSLIGGRDITFSSLDKIIKGGYYYLIFIYFPSGAFAPILS